MGATVKDFRSHKTNREPHSNSGGGYKSRQRREKNGKGNEEGKERVYRARGRGRQEMRLVLYL